MREYVEKALFVYTEESALYVDTVLNNPHGVFITPVPYEEFLDTPATVLSDIGHVVASCELAKLREIFRLAMRHGFSMGLIPIPNQKRIMKTYGIPDTIEEALEIALRKDAPPVDLIFCNDIIVFTKATVGQLPLLDSTMSTGRFPFILRAMKRLLTLRFHPLSITINGKRKIDTVGNGCMILQHHENTLASQLIAHDSAINDGMISLVVSAPLSVVDYFKFLYRVLARKGHPKNLPTTGYIKCPVIDIDAEEDLPILIDEDSTTRLPLHCETIPRAVRLNVGESLRVEGKSSKPSKEKILVDNLPTGKELAKTKGKRIPFFPFATEENFRNLFISLRKDAEIDTIYLVLIVLSAMLATIGLYQSSTAVVIGAMLLAPLMAPIVSFAMGLVRYDSKMSRSSFIKIVVGTGLALLSAILVTLIFRYKPMTPEMQARLRPSLLDLLVALVSGVAGAYAKSHKEIIESLAGVAIAVALIPPLAVAGIGLGRGNLFFFSQAFLLYLTNLIGIVLASTFTFRFLGYSSAVGNKKGIGVVLLLTALITIPLYLTTRRITNATALEKRWKQERFLVNDKYLIVKDARVVYQRNHKILFAKVLTRAPLNRDDLNQLRDKIQSNITGDMRIRIQVIYIP